MKFDLLLMKVRQRAWARASRGQRDSGFFLTLSSDSSPQSGLEYYMVLEDRISRKAAAQLVNATVEELRQWSTVEENLRTAVLPLTVLGSGKQTTAAKFESLAHAVLLDTAWNADTSHCANYAGYVVGFCSDYGAEGQLPEVPPIKISALQERNVKASGGLLLHRQQGNVARVDMFSDMFEDELSARMSSSYCQERPSVPSEDVFSLQGALMIPGVKHMLNNIEGDVLETLHCFAGFQATLLQIGVNERLVFLLRAFGLRHMSHILHGVSSRFEVQGFAVGPEPPRPSWSHGLIDPLKLMLYEYVGYRLNSLKQVT